MSALYNHLWEPKGDLGALCGVYLNPRQGGLEQKSLAREEEDPRWYWEVFTESSQPKSYGGGVCVCLQTGRSEENPAPK